MAIPTDDKIVGQSGHTTDHNSLAAWATTADSTLTSHGSRLTDVESDIAGLPADIAGDIGSLESRMTVAEGDIVALEGLIATKITVGTAAPGSPSVNDIWIDTN